MIRETRQQVNEQQTRKKKQKRMHDEHNKMQKQQKIEKLRSSMLPDDLLGQISESRPSLPVKRVMKAKTTFDDGDDDDDDEDDLLDNIGGSEDLSDYSDLSGSDTEYMSLNPKKKPKGGIISVALANAEKPLLKLAKEVTSFKKEQLYSPVNVKRVSSKKMMRNRSKRQARNF